MLGLTITIVGLTVAVMDVWHPGWTIQNGPVLCITAGFFNAAFYDYRRCKSKN